MKGKQKRIEFSTRKMAVSAILGAVCMVLGATPLGFIPLGVINITIMHIPVILGAILEGPWVGMTVGLLFGVFSMIRAITIPSVVSVIFMNPLVSVLPRVALGAMSYYLYRLLKIFFTQSWLSYAFTGALSSLFHTFAVLGMVYLLYAQAFLEARGLSSSNAAVAIGAIGLSNGIPEMIAAFILVGAICKALRFKNTL